MITLSPVYDQRTDYQLMAFAAAATEGFDLYDIGTGELHGTVKGRETPAISNAPLAPYPNPMRFVHNGQALIGGSPAGHVHLWDVASKCVVQILRHEGLSFATIVS